MSFPWFDRYQAASQRPNDWPDPRVALLCILSFVTVQATTPIDEWPRFVGYATLLLAVALWARISVRWVARRLVVSIPLVAAVAVSVLAVRPSSETVVEMPVAGLRVSSALLLLLASVSVKGTLSIVALSLPVALWDFPVLLRALQGLRVPKLILVIVGFMWRYAHVLVEEAYRMLRAREARGVPGSLWRQVRVTGAMIGSLFLRGYERAERIGYAMVARGFDGRVRLIVPLKALGVAEVATVVIAAALLCVVRLI